MIYWGISLNLGKIPGGTILVNYLLGGLMGYATYPIMIVAMLKIGRKPIQIVCMIASGIGCIVAAVVPKHIGKQHVLLIMFAVPCRRTHAWFHKQFQDKYMSVINGISCRYVKNHTDTKFVQYNLVNKN